MAMTDPTTLPEGATYTNDDRRTEYELDEDGMKPAELLVMGDPHTDLIEAVVAALEDAPSLVANPVLKGSEQASRCESDRQLAYVAARMEEQPVTGDDGEIKGWKPKYQACEDWVETLNEQLPDGVFCEEYSNHNLVLALDVGREASEVLGE